MLGTVDAGALSEIRQKVVLGFISSKLNLKNGQYELISYSDEGKWIEATLETPDGVIKVSVMRRNGTYRLVSSNN